MSQINQRIFLEYPQNFRSLPTYGFAHAKVKKWISDPKILEVVGGIGIIWIDFQSWFYSTTRFWMILIWVQIPGIPGIQPNYESLTDFDPKKCSKMKFSM